MKKPEKIFFVQNLVEELKTAKSVVLINFERLDVKKQQELKKRLAEVGAKMIVSKNTLFKRAGNLANLDKEVLSDSVLQGPTALVIASEDSIAPLQVLGKFATEFEIPQFKVGIVEGSFQDRDSLVKLSKLPGRDILFGQLLTTISGPTINLIYTLSSPQVRLLTLLKNRAENIKMAKGGENYVG